MLIDHKSFEPRASCIALPGYGATLPRLTGTLWHGTRLERLPQILEEGLVPSKSVVGHTCLTRDPAIALFFARLAQSLNGAPEGTDPVLIRIDADSLDPALLHTEIGCVKISAYGKTLPGRSRSSLESLGDDWLQVFEATDCVGTAETLRVDEAMIDRRTAELDPIGIADIMAELDRGVPACPRTRALCERLRAETTLELALAA